MVTFVYLESSKRLAEDVLAELKVQKQFEVVRVWEDEEHQYMEIGIKGGGATVGVRHSAGYRYKKSDLEKKILEAVMGLQGR